MPPTPPTLDEKHLEIIKRGAISTVVLQPLDYNAAVALRMRLYRTKTTLISTAHELATCAKLITIRLRPGKAGAWSLIVEPKDKGFETAYSNANISPQSGNDPPDLE